MAARKHAPNLEISDDGKKLRRRDALPNWSEIERRTVYVENMSPNMDAKPLTKLFSKVGEVERVYLPFKRPHRGYGFVVFSHPGSVEIAVNLSEWKKLYPGVDLKSWIGENTAFPFRVMPKNVWNERMAEYTALLAKKKAEEVKGIPKKSSSAAQTGLQRGVIAKYRGVHPETDRRTLKKLFELVAPVAYVDHTISEASGYVRFETPHGAQLAVAYFSQECVGQLHKSDTGSFVSSASKKAAKGSAESSNSEAWGWEGEEDQHGDDKPTFVTLELVTDYNEEKRYWERIEQMRAMKKRRWEPEAGASRSSVVATSTHVVFDESDDEEASERTPLASEKKNEDHGPKDEPSSVLPLKRHFVEDEDSSDTPSARKRSKPAE
ncbi:hypothetical protein HK104_010866 [Borealophlyctis nickersoniae]|nr:hypothetical protein HK104_010866 [Borealophlyctis nickersoniae]